MLLAFTQSCFAVGPLLFCIVGLYHFNNDDNGAPDLCSEEKVDACTALGGGVVGFYGKIAIVALNACVVSFNVSYQIGNKLNDNTVEKSSMGGIVGCYANV